MGYLERNSETLKTPGFSGFDSRVSGFSRVVIFGFGSGSGSKKVGLFPRVSGFRVQRPITICAYKYSDRILPVLCMSVFCQYSSTFLQVLCQYSVSS